ncbi:hypothetical protein V500_01639 [Pseudogymnoascus sp. VKM F-4518 (FW-2643)]|nr:hypothetical protein V500_01639 [Pseudogymnoascus sp. VKM F-4518 (FW-2643)]
MSQLTSQNHCSACEATSAQWARANASTHSKLDLGSPGKPYPIPPTLGTDSHPYARQIGNTEIMTAPEPEVPQNKVWIQPEYNVVIRKNADLDFVKELVANIFPPGSKSKEGAGPMPPRPNVPTPPGVPPRYRLPGLKMEGAIPPPRSYVPTPPYECLSGFSPEDALPTPRPNVPLPPDAPPNQSLSRFNTEDALLTPRPNVPLPPDAPPNQSLSSFNLPTPRPNVPLPPDAPPNQSISGFNPEDALPTPRPNVPLPPDAPPNS